MICCAIGAAAVATGAVGWRRFRRHSWRPSKPLALAVGLMAMITMTIAGLTVEHLHHHAAYASSNEEPLLTDLGTLPLCRGDAPADRPTDIASIEE